MPDRHCPAMPQVTAMDDQFGTHRQARSVFQAIRGLAEARAKHLAGQVPDEVVKACRRAERAFATVVRAELGSPDLDW